MIKFLEKRKLNRRLTNVFLKKVNNTTKIKPDFIKKKDLRQQWVNNIYTFNNNMYKNLPVLTHITNNIIKSYFYLYNSKIESKLGIKPLRARYKRLNTNKIFISKPSLKHSSDNVFITIFFFNGHNIYLSNKLKQLDVTTELTELLSKKSFYSNDVNKLWLSEKYNMKAFRRNLIFKTKLITDKLKPILLKINKQKSMLSKFSILNTKKLRIYEVQVYKSFLRKTFIQQQLKIFYKQLFYINNLKFKDIYLIKLKNLVSKIYNKKVEFNFIDLKSIYYNSDIFTETISSVLRDRRKSVTSVLNKSIENVKISPFNRIIDVPTYTKKYKSLFSNKILNINVNNINNVYKKDILQLSLMNIFKDKNTNKLDYYLESDVFSSIKYKSLTGIKLEAKGRLSKRLVADRSVSELRNLGTTKNIDSSYKYKYSPMIIGYNKPNVQFSKTKYNNRNGSYGIKGWLGSK